MNGLGQEMRLPDRPSLWEGFLVLGRNACPVVGRRTRLPELGRGKFDTEGERSASPFSNPAESMSADGPCVRLVLREVEISILCNRVLKAVLEWIGAFL